MSSLAGLRILSACTLLGKDEGEGIMSGYFHWHHLFLCEQWDNRYHPPCLPYAV